MKTGNMTNACFSRSFQPLLSITSAISSLFARRTTRGMAGWFFLATVFLALPGRATIYVWNGAGSSGNWSDAGNWSFMATPPTNGDTLIFQGFQPRPVTTNDIANLTLNQIRFLGSNYFIYGNSFTITNSIVVTNKSLSGSDTISVPNLTLATADVPMLVSNAATLSLVTSVGGSVGIIKLGGGALQFGGSPANTYAGTTTVNGGTLQLGKSYATIGVPGPLVIGSGATVRLLNSFQIDSPATPVTMADSSLFDLNGFNEWVGPVSLQGAQITSGGGLFYFSGDITVNASTVAQSVISGNAVIYNGVYTITNSGHIYSPDLLFSANISYGGSTNGLIKTGAGEVSLAGNNSFTGPVTINGGNLWAQTSTALGNTNTPATVNSGGSLFLDGFGLDFGAKPLVLSGAGYAFGAISCSGSSSWEGGITLAADSTIYPFAGASLNLAGLITGPGGFIQAGPGTNTLSGSGENTYTGATVVNTGILLLNHSSGHSIGNSSSITIGDGIGGSDVDIIRYINTYGNQIFGGIPITINSSGLYDLNGHTDDAGPFILNGGDLFTGSGTLTADFGDFNVLTSNGKSPIISGNVQMYGNTITVNNDTNLYDLQIPASISDNGSGFRVVNGTTPGAFVRLTGSNSFTGPLTISGVTVTAETPWTLGTTNGATFVTNNGELFMFATSITNESVTLAAGSTFTAQYNCSWYGPVILTGDATINNFASTGTFDIVGQISGAGNLTSVGNTNRFSGSTANTYAGNSTVSSGTLVLNKSIGVAVPGNVVVNSGGTLRLGSNGQTANAADVLVNGGGLFDFSTFYTYLDTLHGTGTVNFGVGGWIYVGLNNGSSEFDGTFTGTGYSPGWTVGKTGTGTFTIGGNSTYTAGITHVLGGKVVINGSQPQVPVTVDSGATLGGSGTINYLLANGTISPGNSPGILNTSSNVTFSSTGNFTVELTGTNAGSGYDQLNVTGTVALANATLTVIPAFTTPVAIGQQFTIISNDFTEAVSGTFNGLPNGVLFSASGYTFRINYAGGSGNDVVLTLWGIPGNTVTVNAADQGWYDSTGLNTPGNQNYFAGQDNIVSDTNLYRNWFVFNVPVSSGPIIHAELLINDYQSSSPHGQETYLLRKVATPIATLEAGGSGLVGIYNDLGTGAVYSARSIATNEAGQKAIIPLNAKFMTDAAAAAGGQMALGGSLATLAATNNHNQYLFAYSGYAPDDVQLRLTFGTSLVINATNTGWYNYTGAHSSGNLNYFVGDDTTYLYRNFFVFRLPVLSSQLVDAQLLLNSYTDTSPSGFETYQLYDVTNSITVLTNNASTATNVYADLGGGNVYGGRDVYVSESGTVSTIPLNGNFLTAALANSGGRIALGGALTSLSLSPTNEGLFGYSLGLTNDAQLWLGFLAAPASHPHFVGATPTYLGNSQFQLTVAGTAGTTNEIQGSFDFQRWDFIRDVIMTGSTTSFLYTNNAVVPYRFFRAEQLQ